MGGRSAARAFLIATALVAAAATVAPAPVGAAPGAAITGTFAESCRTFLAHSSKDISHVQVHYADGRVVKDEAISSPDYALQGSTGDEITSIVVKSSTTMTSFSCTPRSSAPTAYLEILVHEGCDPDGFGSPPYMLCHAAAPRSVWARPGGVSEGNIQIGVTREADVLPQVTWSFRGTTSSDPDNDIANWTIDFGDGSPPIGGSWTISPPVEVTHTFASCLENVACTVTVGLTVTDAAGQRATDTLTIHFFDTTPD
jgi:hypothetical protein